MYCFRSVIVSVRVPYSWMFRRMCWAYADWGSLFFMYLMCSLYLMDIAPEDGRKKRPKHVERYCSY